MSPQRTGPSEPAGLQCELLRRVRLDAADAQIDARGTLTVPSWGGRPLVPPLRVRADEDALRELTSISPEDRAALWPRADSLTAGFNLLLVHLHELAAADRRDDGVVDLTVRR